eukprot:TRINITY_DN15862_c0_g1_i2.p1 TRINITY_DN15862_c0_g1~~TRINITY_DN15862_c0_g1_i2.p1  ORF type:complete len:720 (+),score=160.41 TRINITY_DN15862_c0_g1_i2:96-2255(+)
MGLRSRNVRPLGLEPVEVYGTGERRGTEPVLRRGFSCTSGGLSDVMSDTPLRLMQDVGGARVRDTSPFSSSSKCSSTYRGRRAVSPLGGSGRYTSMRSPKKASEMYRKFIDVDVMKSLTDLACKPPKPVAFQKAVTRVVLFPLYPSFWLKVISVTQFYFLAVLWICEVFAFYLYATRDSKAAGADRQVWDDVSDSEVYFAPLCLLFIGLVFGRIPTASQKTKYSRGSVRKAPIVEDGVSHGSSAGSSASSSSSSGSASTSPSDDEDVDDDLMNNGFDSPKQQRRDDFLDAALLAESERQTSSVLESSYSALQFSTDDEDDQITVLVWGDKNLEGSMSLPEILRRSGEKRPFKIAVTAKEVRETILNKVEEEATKRPASVNMPFWTALAFSVFPTVHRMWMLRDQICDYLLSESATMSTTYTLDFPQNLTLPTPPIPAHPLHMLATILLHPSTPNAPLAHSLMVAFVVSLSAASVFVLTRKMVAHLAMAERTYHKRYLYAKFFSALTSLRRSQRYNLPHFRLKNVENVMAWLTLRGSRAWLRLEPQEIAADSCVSLTFQLFLFVVGCIGMIVIKEGADQPKKAVSVENFSEVMHGQVFFTALVLSYYLVFHFMMMGTSINHKYGNSSLLLTEQLNIQLRMVAVVDRPGDHRTKVKKEKLILTNKVLELAAKLLKELEGPNKISGLSMNPLLYNITRVMVLSCLSAAFSHIVGFTPKLWKI